MRGRARRRLRTLYAGELGGIGGRREKLVFRDAAGNDLSGRLGKVKPGSMQEAIGVVERAVGLDGLPPPDAVGLSRGASGGASARASAADGGGAGEVARGVRVRSAARSRRRWR